MGQGEAPEPPSSDKDMSVQVEASETHSQIDPAAADEAAASTAAADAVGASMPAIGEEPSATADVTGTTAEVDATHLEGGDVAMEVDEQPEVSTRDVVIETPAEVPEVPLAEEPSGDVAMDGQPEETDSEAGDGKKRKSKLLGMLSRRKKNKGGESEGYAVDSVKGDSFVSGVEVGGL